ncbi:MAG: preprotein translocase subunit Sec61beta [Thermoprotei archaeon]|nr:MAG: preprotein translocase subunit Sec61beta [Thermoprotei archaeon]RLF02708.1 MAG: preprotein translocase subunit Sec61beta [Thermoprotei archaeon]
MWMSKRKRKEKEKEKGERAPPPISGAGLVTFYQEEIKGIKIRPVYIILASIILITVVLLADVGILAP